MVVAITATEQDEYPPRVLVSVTGLTIGDTVAVYRSVSGVRTAVRGGTTASAPATALLALDAELPFGVPITYVAVVEGVDHMVGPETYTLPGGNVVLSDAITGLSSEVLIGAWPERENVRLSSRFQQGGRNVVVSGDMAGFTGQVEFFIRTDSSREGLKTLLANATEGIIQMRCALPDTYGGVDCYVSVDRMRERRYSQDGSDQKRLITLDVVEVEAWPDTLTAAGYSYQDLEDLYTGLTYTDLSADYATYLDLAQADLIP